MKSVISKILTIAAALLAAAVSYAQELKESPTWKNIVSHPAPLPVIGRIAPVQSDLNEASFWSVGSETLDRDFAEFENYRKYMKETGVGYARLQSGWEKTEKVKGQYDFGWFDAHVDGLIAEGIHPWVCLCYSNTLYSEYGRRNLFPDGPVMDAWLDYVRACVTRYKGKVTMWEIWNEPDLNKGPYDQYANLFVRTAKVIREADPEAKIAAFGACLPDKPYVRQALELIDKAGGMKYMDYVTYHAYKEIPESIIPGIEELKKWLSEYDCQTGILQGETGCPGRLEYSHALRNREWSEYSQAKWDLRQALTHFGMGVPYSFFTMVDLNYGNMLQSFGLIRQNGIRQPVYKRPKFHAVQHVTSVFTPDMKVTDKVKVLSQYNVELTSYGLQKDGKVVGCMLWISGERPSDSLERKNIDINMTGINFKEPVYVDMLTGYVHDLKAVARRLGALTVDFNDLPVLDSPVLIVEKAAVDVVKE